MARPVLHRFDVMAIVIGVVFALMWSSAFTAAKIALVDAPPFLILTLRFFISGVLALIVAFALGQRLPGERRQWGAIILLGLCQNSLYLGLNFKAMTLVSAGLAAILASSVPLLVALLCRVILKERLSWIGYLGLVLGFAGVLTIMFDRIAGGSSSLGILFCLLGAGAMAGATLIVRNTDLGDGLLMIVGLQMLVGSISLLPIVVLFEDVQAVRFTASLAITFAYIVLVPGLLATFVWFYLVRRIGATHAAAFHFLNPAFGVIIAQLLLGELIGLHDILGVAIIMVSILAVQFSRAGLKQH